MYKIIEESSNTEINTINENDLFDTISVLSNRQGRYIILNENGGIVYDTNPYIDYIYNN